VERACSDYNSNASRGTEPAATFGEAVESVLRGERDDWVYGWRYLDTGLYARHLARYFDHFERERVAVLRFDKLRANPTAVYAAACRFLDVEPVALPPEDIAARNVTALPRNSAMRAIKNLLTAANPLKRVTRALVPSGLRRRASQVMIGAVDRFGVRPPPMDPATRARLADYYREPNAELAALLGQRFDDWDTR
jgi:hypothetical protein